MFGGVLALRELEVSDVMIHRTNMITLDADDTPEDIVNAVIASPVTRACRCGAAIRKTSSAFCM